MQKYARLDESNIVIETWSDGELTPFDIFTPALAEAFHECPDEVGQLWTLNTQDWSWTPPVTPEAPAVIPPKMTPVEFLLLFSPQERVTIRQAAAIDPAIADFLSIIEHPRLREVDLALASTQQGIEYALTVAGSPNVQDRKAQILTGVIQ